MSKHKLGIRGAADLSLDQGAELMQMSLIITQLNFGRPRPMEASGRPVVVVYA
jgi:hypothetical protein